MNIIFLGIARAVPALGAIFFNLFVAKWLKPNEADIFFLWFSIFYAISFLSKLGFDVYLLKEISAGGIRTASSYKKLTFLVSIVLCGIFTQISPPEVWGIFFGLPFFSVAALNSSIIRGQGKDLVSGLIEVSLVSAASLFLLAILDGAGFKISLESICLLFFAASIIVFFVGEYLAGSQNWILSAGPPLSASVVLHGFRFSISPFVIYATQWAVLLFLYFAPSGEISNYSVGARLAAGFAFIAITLDAFVAPRFAKLFKDRSLKEIEILIRKTRKQSSILFVVVLTPYVLLGEIIVSIFIGKEYVDAFKISIVLSFTYFIILFIGPYQYFLLMSGHERKVNIYNLLALAMVISICGIIAALSLSNSLTFSYIVCISRVTSTLLMRSAAIQLLKEEALWK